MYSLKIDCKFSGIWNNPFYSIMNQNERKQLCESFRTAVVFISENLINDEEKLNYLLFLTKERSRDFFFEISFVNYDNIGSIPSLVCIFERLQIHLMKNSNYDYYMINAKKDNISSPTLLGILSEPLNIAVINYNSFQLFKDVFKTTSPGEKANTSLFSFYLHLEFKYV